MTAPSTALFEYAAEFVESVLRRIGSRIEFVEQALFSGIESAASTVTAVPAPLVIALVGLVVWGGRRLVQAIVVVIALQLVVVSELWPSIVSMTLLGIVAGAIGGTIALGFVQAVRPIRRRVRWMSQLGASIVVSIIVVTVVTVTAPITSAGQPAWHLSAILLAAALAVRERSFEQTGHRWRQLSMSVLEAGIPAALFIGMLSGSGLGGLAVRAMGTRDIALALQVFLAMTGLVVALVAATARHDQSHDGAAEGGPGTPLGPEPVGDRL